MPHLDNMVKDCAINRNHVFQVFPIFIESIIIMNFTFSKRHEGCIWILHQIVDGMSSALHHILSVRYLSHPASKEQYCASVFTASKRSYGRVMFSQVGRSHNAVEQVEPPYPKPGGWPPTQGYRMRVCVCVEALSLGSTQYCWKISSSAIK